VTTFEDGPARGQTLELKRAPRFLRVCRAPDLTFDALDLMEDTPKPEETLIAYERTEGRTVGFIDYGGKDRHKSGPFTSCRYRMIAEQPDDAVMRDGARWRQWCVDRSENGPAPSKPQTVGRK
jgi:hypothetical protein